MEKRVKSGTGLSLHSLDREEMKVEIDLSGDYDNNCFRNDASIFFFAANSYKHAFYLIGKELEKRFSEGAKHKDIEHLILPYCFNFRHYVELELKGYIVALDNAPPGRTHNLSVLLESVSNMLESIEIEDRSIFTENADANIEKACFSMDIIKDKIATYLETEPAADFYRYIFDKDMKKLMMRETVISLDFVKTRELFRDVMREFNNVYTCLREAGLYIYQL